MTQSSWDETKKRSQYHFDPKTIDPTYDTVTYLGSFSPVWSNELEKIIADSKAVTWRTRGNPDKLRPESELAAEDYDLERFGYGADYAVSNINWEIPQVLQRVSQRFALDDAMVRIHVQQPGQVWNLHLDKLEKWNPNNPSSIARFMIQLTDWQPGHYWSYGNYQHSGWSAGDVTTFDWQNVPHSTANAGHTPRVTLQVTGIVTDQTRNFLRELRARSPYPL